MPDTGRYQNAGRVMVCRQSAVGTGTFYPAVGTEYGTSSSASDSVFTQEGSAVLRPKHKGIIIGVYTTSGELYHSTQVDKYQEFRILDDDDVYLHAGNFRVTKNSVTARRDDVNATTGQAEAKGIAAEDLWIPVRNGMRVEIEKEADSGVLILCVVYIVKR